MKYQTNLPAKITNITVCANQAELGVLNLWFSAPLSTHTKNQHISLTMTQKAWMVILQSAPPNICAETYQKGLIGGLLLKSLPDIPRSMICISWHYKGDQGIGILSYQK